MPGRAVRAGTLRRSCSVRRRTDSPPNRTHAASSANFLAWESVMGLGMILLLVLVVLTLGAVPAWPHSRGWGYAPVGGLGLVMLIVLVLLLMGRL
jgi:hypothetical protein